MVERLRKMKSYNHLYEYYISDENIKLAIKNACKHKLNRRRFKKLHDDPDKYIPWIREQATNFHNDKHTPIEIYDGIQRKKRTIIVPSFREQIIHHMVVNVLKPIVMKRLYEHSYGSIPGRGGTLGMKRMKKWLKNDTEGTRYCLKMDIRKYFDTVPHDVVIRRLTKQIHDERFLNVLLEIINVNDKGLPLGFYTSQWLANWYLTELDHYIKEKLGARYYMRYMDDMIVYGPDKTELHKIRKEIASYLETNLGLELKDNWQVFPIESRFLDFMGYRFYRSRVTLRKSVLIKACRKARRLYKASKPTMYSIKQTLSYLGWFSQTDTYNAFTEKFARYINVQYLKRRISKHDKRMAELSRRLQAA